MAKVRYIGKGNMYTQDILFTEGKEAIEVDNKVADYLAQNFAKLFEIEKSSTKKSEEVETPKKKG